MEPRNDHERTIARIVDDLAREGKLSIDMAIARLNFVMVVSDSDFLIDYFRSRTENPIAKAG